MIDPLYHKNAYDYDENFEICIEASNDVNINKKSKLTSNLILDIEYHMCHSSEWKYNSKISQMLESMKKCDFHNLMNKPQIETKTPWLGKSRLEKNHTNKKYKT